MNKKFKPYSEDVLPKNFTYPQRYLDMACGKEEKLAIWRCKDAGTPGGDLAWKLRKKYTEWKNIGNRELIPLAQLNDWAAFFDGDCNTGNPKVIVIDLGNKRNSYELADFDAWYMQACED